MTRYRWDGAGWVNRATGEPMERPHTIAAPQVLPDLPAYVSPLGDGVIEGRAARREHLKRNGCREVDPSEHKPSYLNREFAAKHGKAWDEAGARARDEWRAKAQRERLNEAAHDTARLMRNRN